MSLPGAAGGAVQPQDRQRLRLCAARQRLRPTIGAGRAAGHRGAAAWHVPGGELVDALQDRAGDRGHSPRRGSLPPPADQLRDATAGARYQGLQFGSRRSHCHRLSGAIEQRLHSEPVTRQKQRAFTQVVDGKGEHAMQAGRRNRGPIFCQAARITSLSPSVWKVRTQLPSVRRAVRGNCRSHR